MNLVYQTWRLRTFTETSDGLLSLDQAVLNSLSTRFIHHRLPAVLLYRSLPLPLPNPQISPPITTTENPRRLTLRTPLILARPHRSLRDSPTFDGSVRPQSHRALPTRNCRSAS